MKLTYLSFIGGLLVMAACGGGSSEDSSQAGSAASPTAPTSTAQPRDETAGNGFPAVSGWSTDFSKATVSRDEIARGAPRDAIPAIDNPKFLAVGETDFLEDQEPVIAFQEGDVSRAYPLQVMTWHEIVNDEVDGRPVLITFCPLCNTAIAFDRTVEGEVLEFGVSGFLRNSDLVMFDRATETWWQQITGEAIVGQHVGTSLEFLPVSIVSWADFKQTFPDGEVLSRDTGHRRSYGTNPYAGYDDINSSPFLYDGETDDRLAAMERVVTVELGGEVVAYPFSRLEEQPVINDSVGGTEIAVFFKPGTTSALDRSSIANSRDIGSATVYNALSDGQRLTFEAEGETFTDEETGSTWDIFGRAVAGPLQGRSLEPVLSGNHFWFAWAAFQPETRVWDGP